MPPFTIPARTPVHQASQTTVKEPGDAFEGDPTSTPSVTPAATPAATGGASTPVRTFVLQTNTGAGLAGENVTEAQIKAIHADVDDWLALKVIKPV